jgi:nicotinamidase-related amidase
MTTILTKQTALILIDIQKGFDQIDYWGDHRNNPEAEVNAARLLALWRENDFSIFHIKHCSLNPNSILVEGHPGNDFKEITAPIAGETIIKKNVNSAFINTDLKRQLDDLQVNKIVLVGLTTDHCISTTARMAGNYGYEVFVVRDATATFDRKGSDDKHFSAQTMHDTALASLNGEFATILNTADLAL